MTDNTELRPWLELDAIAEARDPVRLVAWVEARSPSEMARALAHLSVDEQNRVLEALSPEAAAELIQSLPIAQAADLVEHLDSGTAAAIVHELDSDDQADLVDEMEVQEAQAVLAALAPQEALSIRALARYDGDVAGGLMMTEVIAVSSKATLAEVVAHFRRETDEVHVEIQYIYVLDEGRRLTGILRIRDLLQTDHQGLVESIMIPNPIMVGAQADLQELEDLFDRHGFLALPVVDDDGALLGLVTQSSVRDAAGERAETDHLKSAGIVGGEELRTMPMLLRSRRRLGWLSINIVLNVVAASVIALFEETLTAVIALAFFLPIISDMSGCSGNQAVAVSIRELALGLVKPYEVFYVWLKEIGIGIINGATLGALIGVIAWLWRGNPYLGVVVGLALMANTMIAVSIGGAVPLLLKRFNVDPALASGPVLTTITDICGFFLVLGIATAMLPLLL